MKYQISKTPDKGEECWSWHLFGDSGQEIANGGELFLKTSIQVSIKNVRDVAKDAPIWKDESPEDKDKGYRFEYTENPKGTWGWILRSGNHQTIAVGSKNYPSEEAVKDAIKDIQKTMANAEIAWQNPEDDPAYQEKHDDRTKTTGIAGS